MNSSKDQLGDSLFQSITHPNADLLTDIAELGIDELLADSVNEIVSEIPVVKSVLSVFKTGVSMKNYFFFKKLLRFLLGIDDIDLEIRKKLEQSYEDPKTKQEFGEQLLMTIDRLETYKKIDALIKLFSALAEGKINHSEFNRYVYVIENIDFENLSILTNFYLSEIVKVSSSLSHLLRRSNSGYIYNKNNQFRLDVNDEDIRSLLNWRSGYSQMDKLYFIQNFVNVGLISIDSSFIDIMLSRAIDMGVEEVSKGNIKNLRSKINQKLDFYAGNDQFKGFSCNSFGLKFLETLDILIKTSPN